MRLTKRQIEKKMEEIAFEMVAAEFRKDPEAYYELLEQRTKLEAALRRGEYEYAPSLPHCDVCGKAVSEFRQIHRERGDGAEGYLLCYRCVTPNTGGYGKQTAKYDKNGKPRLILPPPTSLQRFLEDGRTEDEIDLEAWERRITYEGIDEL